MKGLTKSPLETKRLGENFARKIIKNNNKYRKAIVICLEGDLGGGKTTFVQGFAKGLGIKEKILSPTFIIMRKFRIFPTKRDKSFFRYLYHIDCYRLNSSKDINGLDFEDIISDPRNIVIVEWAGRVKKILSSCNVFIKFHFVNAKTRKIVVK